MQYGPVPVPHLWACSERTDVKSSCFTLWFLPSSLHPGLAVTAVTSSVSGDMMPCTRCVWVTGRHNDARIQWPLFLKRYIYIFERLWTIQHTVKETEVRTARRGENECLRDIRVFFWEHFVCEYLYTVEELIKKWRHRWCFRVILAAACHASFGEIVHYFLCIWKNPTSLFSGGCGVWRKKSGYLPAQEGLTMTILKQRKPLN